ncbi:hypothetical protein [Vibrio splendidus]|uniref:hypothetical protein n=1 Tax=Vibrio splendidus TaxID=29497 RepID=UPI0010545BA7|nr:hypothetical protein [Vibrio splendidus]
MVRSFRGEQRFIRLHVALNGFTYVHHTNTLALTQLWLSGGTSSHEFIPAQQRLNFVTLSGSLLYSEP